MPSIRTNSLLAPSLLAFPFIHHAHSASIENFHQLQQHLAPDTADILANLDQYAKLWISVPKHHGGEGNCVWSECGLDDQTDDANMGDYRDGDEKWYKYRTQSFCANAAYSLFGIKKEDSTNIFTGKCTRKHFINSFFTYGGADNLLKMLGVEHEVYYSGYGNGQRELANNDDGGYSSSNSNCVEIDYVPDDDDDEGGEEEQNGSRDRHLGSGSQDNQNNGYSSSLGCDPSGNYIIAAFQGGRCDGNYFLKSLDSFDSYNAQHNNIGCRSIWTDDGNDFYANVNYETTYTLLKNSWACDPRLYPNECPDPFGEKGRYEYAFRIAAHGGNGLRAYQNETLRRPLRTVSYVLFALILVVLVLTYFIKNYRRIVKGERRVTAKGCGRVIKEDIVIGFLGLVAMARACGNCKRIRNKGRSKKEDDFYVVELAEAESANRAEKRDKKKGAKQSARYAGAESVRVVDKIDHADKGAVEESRAKAEEPANCASKRELVKALNKRSVKGPGETQKASVLEEEEDDFHMVEANVTSKRGTLDPPDQTAKHQVAKNLAKPADNADLSTRKVTRAERNEVSPPKNIQEAGDHHALKAHLKAMRKSEAEKDDDFQMVLSEDGAIKKIESPKSKAKAKAKSTDDVPFDCKNKEGDDSYQMLRTSDGKEGVLL